MIEVFDCIFILPLFAVSFFFLWSTFWKEHENFTVEIGEWNYEHYSNYRIPYIPNPTNSTCTPLILLVNKNSGNKDASHLLNLFRPILHPLQIIDLNRSNIKRKILWISELRYKPIIVIAGGDGTVGWILNSFDLYKVPTPPIALYPLGTGNDLSRSLGFGAESSNADTVETIINQIKNFHEIKLDRWKVHVLHSRLWSTRFFPQTLLYFQNYCSIGVDALVTYNFHKARESPFYFFSSRLLNKLIYFSYGTKDILERECKDLDQCIQLYCDGEYKELPSGIESIVVLNIPSWGSGVELWNLGNDHKNFPPQEINDRKLEVLCIYSSFHIGQMQIGLSEPVRICQARSVKIHLKKSVPMQMDGEPWEQHPSELEISHYKQISVLASP